jgi:hypothetical protein
VHFAHSFYRKIEASPLSERTRSTFDAMTSSNPCFVRAGFALKPPVVILVTRYWNVFSSGVKSTLMNISLARISRSAMMRGNMREILASTLRRRIDEGVPPVATV